MCVSFLQFGHFYSKLMSSRPEKYTPKCKDFRVITFIAILGEACIGELSPALLICYAEGYSEIRGGTSRNCTPVLDH